MPDKLQNTVNQRPGPQTIPELYIEVLKAQKGELHAALMDISGISEASGVFDGREKFDQAQAIARGALART
jgi:hypothetical protein